MTSHNLDRLATQIRSTAAVPAAAYWLHSEAVFGPKRITKTAITASQVIEVGNSPDGFGKGIIWDRASSGIAMAMFINAADSLGVSIGNVVSTDHITVISAAGIASFAHDTGNPLASSIIGIIGDGIDTVLKATGVGAVAVPLVDKATSFAEAEFKATNAKTKKRDAYGIDPETGSIARQEGGILVSLPAAGGPYYSGDDHHKARWIKSGNSRDDLHLPPQVVHGFFPVQNAHNSRLAGATGDIYVTPWDYNFEDNAGFYKVIMTISKAPLV